MVLSRTTTDAAPLCFSQIRTSLAQRKRQRHLQQLKTHRDVSGSTPTCKKRVFKENDEDDDDNDEYIGPSSGSSSRKRAVISEDEDEDRVYSSTSAASASYRRNQAVNEEDDLNEDFNEIQRSRRSFSHHKKAFIMSDDEVDG